ncbi:MAG: hypothetical protein K6C98_07955 [Treponema sp.]|nr:hypothetical protein [Treponema sp.]
MKKYVLIILTLLFSVNVFCVNVNYKHVYSGDYSLFPKSDYSQFYSNKLKNIFPPNYSFQSLMFIPRDKMKGYSCEEVLNKLDQMGGLDKECQGVCYVDANTHKLKARFKKSEYNAASKELYIKDKTAGGLVFNVDIERRGKTNNVYGVTALLKKDPNNIFLREVRKNQACIFVFMEEKAEGVNLYVLIQSACSPLKLKFLRSLVENAISARVLELQNWFYRMICTEK